MQDLDLDLDLADLHEVHIDQFSSLAVGRKLSGFEISS